MHARQTAGQLQRPELTVRPGVILSLTGLGALEMTADGAATITELKELCGVCGTVEFVDMRNEEGAAQVRFADASMATKAAGFGGEEPE